MKIKTSKLTGTVLDWAVTEALLKSLVQPELGMLIHQIGYGNPINPYSTDWAQGGVILEREKITVGYERYGAQGGETWDAVKKAFDDTVLWLEYAPTPLIAAMRCFVASKLGDEVEIPEELI